MGSWLARMLERQGLQVLCAGRRTALTPKEMARRCDVVVVSVPVSETEEVIRQVGPLVQERGLLMDLTSVKTRPLETMLAYSRSDVVGLHPLFGPESCGSHPRVAVCPGRGREGQDWITGVLLCEGYGIKILEAKEHDRLMGIVQAANHLSTLTLALSIARSGLGLQEIADVATETFRERLDRIRSIVGQPADLFASLLMDNPEAANPIALYASSFEELSRIAGGSDRNGFGDLFELLRQFFVESEVTSS